MCSVLIDLVAIHSAPSPQSVPLANAFLKAYTHECAVSINLVDFYLGQDPQDCAVKLAGTHPVAAGFSMYVWNRDLCCEIASLLRHNHPGILLFCGGPEATAGPESLLNSGIFDFVIVGEGEIPFRLFCQRVAAGEDYTRIPGILVPGGAILPAPSPVTDLDSIPSPYLTGVIDTAATPGLLWQLSRGCSFTCDFCFDARGIHGVRHFSLDRVEAELRHFSATDVAQIFVLDSTFNRDRDRAKKILRMIRKYAPDIHFHFEVRNEFIDREMAALFANITCSLQIGLQSADPDVLKLVGRSFNKSDFTAKVALLNESGAVFGFDLMYGLPGDTLEGFRRSLDYALSLYPNHLDIFPLAVLPGTRLALHGAALSLKWNRHPPYILESTDRFSVFDMTAAAELATACDIFYTRGRAVAWFNAVVTALGLRPSAFLDTFSSWLIDHRGISTKESDFSDDDIREMQQLFLTHLFNGKKTRRLLPLALDLANYHHQYATSLLAPQYPGEYSSAEISDNRSVRFKLAASARIVYFTYDIDELLECGEPRLSWMYEHLSPSGSQAVIYMHKGMVHTESLAAPYARLLEQIRDGVEVNIPSEIELTDNEADDFYMFALQEGIIIKY